VEIGLGRGGQGVGRREFVCKSRHGEGKTKMNKPNLQVKKRRFSQVAKGIGGSEKERGDWDILTTGVI